VGGISVMRIRAQQGCRILGRNDAAPILSMPVADAETESEASWIIISPFYQMSPEW